MSIKQEEVLKVAKLARINLTEDESQKIGQELNDILQIMDVLGEIDTSNVSLEENLRPCKEVKMRKDIVTDGGKTSEILANAPETEFNYFFKVPKMIG